MFKGFLKQATAVLIDLGIMVDSTDGNTEETALTIIYTYVYLSKNGATYAVPNDVNSCTGGAGGIYYKALNETDTGTLGRLGVLTHPSGALVVEDYYMVLAANIYDALMGTDVLETDVVYIAGATVAVASAQLGVNIVNWKGAVAAAMTGDAYALLGSPAGASIAADIASIPTASEIQTELEENGASVLDTLQDRLTASRALYLDELDFTLQENIDSIPTAAEIKTAIEAAGSHLALIKAVTDVESGVKAAVNALNDIAAADVWSVVTRTLTSGEAPSVSEIRTEIDSNSTQLAAIKAKTDNIPASPAAVGSEMALANDAITSAKFDESTAFPVKSADSGATQIARVGADGDTLETLSDQIDGVGASAGSGAITWTYTLTRSDNGNPIAGAAVWATTDEAGTNVVASGVTDVNGVVTFYLDAGTYYIWRQLAGYDFTNPDTEVVS